jgi:hypothetical protein
MTGSVKEEIIARQAEVGLMIENGCLTFNSLLFNPKELLTMPESFNYLDVTRKQQRIDLVTGSLAYTVCQVPIVIQLADAPGIEIYLTDGTIKKINGKRLDAINSRHIFHGTDLCTI